MSTRRTRFRWTRIGAGANAWARRRTAGAQARGGPSVTSALTLGATAATTLGTRTDGATGDGTTGETASMRPRRVPVEIVSTGGGSSAPPPSRAERRAPWRELGSPPPTPDAGPVPSDADFAAPIRPGPSTAGAPELNHEAPAPPVSVPAPARDPLHPPVIPAPDPVVAGPDPKFEAPPAARSLNEEPTEPFRDAQSKSAPRAASPTPAAAAAPPEGPAPILHTSVDPPTSSRAKRRAERRGLGASSASVPHLRGAAVPPGPPPPPERPEPKTVEAPSPAAEDQGSVAVDVRAQPPASPQASAGPTLPRPPAPPAPVLPPAPPPAPPPAFTEERTAPSEPRPKSPDTSTASSLIDEPTDLDGARAGARPQWRASDEVLPWVPLILDATEVLPGRWLEQTSRDPSEEDVGPAELESLEVHGIADLEPRAEPRGVSREVEQDLAGRRSAEAKTEISLADLDDLLLSDPEDEGDPFPAPLSAEVDDISLSTPLPAEPVPIRPVPVEVVVGGPVEPGSSMGEAVVAAPIPDLGASFGGLPASDIGTGGGSDERPTARYPAVEPSPVRVDASADAMVEGAESTGPLAPESPEPSSPREPAPGIDSELELDFDAPEGLVASSSTVVPSFPGLASAWLEGPTTAEEVGPSADDLDDLLLEPEEPTDQGPATAYASIVLWMFTGPSDPVGRARTGRIVRLCGPQSEAPTLGGAVQIDLHLVRRGPVDPRAAARPAQAPPAKKWPGAEPRIVDLRNLPEHPAPPGPAAGAESPASAGPKGGGSEDWLDLEP